MTNIPVNERNKRQIGAIMNYSTLNHPFEVICAMFSVVSFIAIFSTKTVPFWVFIIITVVLLIPLTIRIIWLAFLKKKVINNPSVSIILKNPKAKLITDNKAGITTIHVLKIKGEYNGKTLNLVEYPIRSSNSYYFKKLDQINGKDSIEVSIIEKTNLVDCFYEEKVSKSKKANKSYKDFFTKKEHGFKYAPISVEEKDMIKFLKEYSLYEELYLLNEFGYYAVVYIAEDGKDKDYKISIGSTQIDDVEKTMSWLEENGFINNGELKLISLMDMNDPSLFFSELND